MFLIGADPEVFAVKDGQLVSAHGMIPGTKKEPFPVSKGAVQVDGMALEFNIDPAHSEQEFVLSLNQVMRQLRKMVPGYDLLAEPVAEFGAEMIDAQPDEAKELGCDPDFNAWDNGKENPIPDVKTPFRTGSGHIHIGLWDPNGPLPVNHNEVCCALAKQLDCYLAAPFSFVDRDLRRRQLYGKAGAFRPKPYGMEYRVLSNKWLSTVSLQRWVYRATQAAIHDLSLGRSHWECEGKNLRNAIDHGNLEYLSDFIRRRNIGMPYGYNKVAEFIRKEGRG